MIEGTRLTQKLCYTRSNRDPDTAVQSLDKECGQITDSCETEISFFAGTDPDQVSKVARHCFSMTAGVDVFLDITAFPDDCFGGVIDFDLVNFFVIVGPSTVSVGGAYDLPWQGGGVVAPASLANTEGWVTIPGQTQIVVSASADVEEVCICVGG